MGNLVIPAEPRIGDSIIVRQFNKDDDTGFPEAHGEWLDVPLTITSINTEDRTFFDAAKDPQGIASPTVVVYPDLDDWEYL